MKLYFQTRLWERIRQEEKTMEIEMAMIGKNSRDNEHRDKQTNCTLNRFVTSKLYSKMGF